jgi:CrcB protein
MNAFLLVFAGSGIGGCLRYAMSQLVGRLYAGPFPYATLAVNVLGGLAMGLLIGWLAAKDDGDNHLRLLLATGVLGGFTTFSAFTLETVLLWGRQQQTLALAYVAASIAAAVAALVAGLALGRSL